MEKEYRDVEDVQQVEIMVMDLNIPTAAGAIGLCQRAADNV